MYKYALLLTGLLIYSLTPLMATSQPFDDSSQKTSVRYLIQDESVNLPKSLQQLREITLKDAWFKKGPACPGITIVGESVALPDRKGNFLNYEYGSNQFDAVHTFAVVFKTFAFWETHLNSLSQQSFIKELAQERYNFWQQFNQRNPLKIEPHKYNLEKNAHYMPSQHKLEFGIVKNKDNKNIWSCQSMDIVAHETGHAILHILQPTFNTSKDAGAFHEAFGDLTAVLLLLDDPFVQQDVITRFKRDLHKVSYIGNLGEEFANAGWSKPGIRDLNRSCTTHTCGLEIHDQSQAFSGAIFDTLAYMIKNTSLNLSHIVDQLSLNLLSGVLISRNGNAEKIANNILKTTFSIWQKPLNTFFQQRELISIPIQRPISLTQSRRSAVALQQFDHQDSEELDNSWLSSWFCYR